jgi:hypothetical protein
MIGTVWRSRRRTAIAQLAGMLAPNCELPLTVVKGSGMRDCVPQSGMS